MEHIMPTVHQFSSFIKWPSLTEILLHYLCILRTDKHQSNEIFLKVILGKKVDEKLNCQVQAPNPSPQNPKTKGPWADTKISWATTPPPHPIIFKLESLALFLIVKGSIKTIP